MNRASPAVAALTHDALLYGSDAAFADAASRFARDGLEAGEAVVAVCPPHNIELLKTALGSQAGDAAFISSEDWYQRPVSTIAGYRGLVEERLNTGAPRVRVLGEIAFGQRPTQHAEWVRYESVVNRVFAEAPAWILCPYDTRVLSEGVIRSAERTHPHIDRGSGRRVSRRYLEPSRMLRQMDPPGAADDASSVEVMSPSQLPTARRWLRDHADGAGLASERADSFVLAANEVITNALRHGGPPVRLRVWVNEGELNCDVTDEGAGLADAAAGFFPPQPADGPEGGMGLWTARHACDALSIQSPATGSAVRLSMQL